MQCSVPEQSFGFDIVSAAVCIVPSLFQLAGGALARVHGG